MGIAYGVADIVSRAIDEQLSQFEWYNTHNEAFSQGILNATGYFPTKEYGFLSEDDPRLGRKRDSWWDFGNSGSFGFQPTPPRPQPTTINVNATLEMDGKVLAEKVLSVVSDSNQAALDDLQSTTER